MFIRSAFLAVALFACSTEASLLWAKDPISLFLQPSGNAKANDECVARILPVLMRKLGREEAIRLVGSKEAADLVAVVNECATYTFRESTATIKGGATPHGNPIRGPGDIEVEQEYGVKTDTRKEFVVTVGLTYGDHLVGFSNDGDEKSLKAAGEIVAKKILKWVKVNLARVRARKE
jgi:hypothetical protein